MRSASYLGLICALALCAGCEALEELGSAPASAQVVQPQEPETTPMLDCFLAAEEAFLSQSRALDLCRNARSTAPVDCYLFAERRLLLSEQQNVALCRCARSTQPVDCFQLADRKTNLSDSQIGDLCNAIDALGLRADCLPRCDRL